MEAERWDLRECSVLLRRCDFVGRGSAARAEGGVPTETHEPVTAAALREVEDYDKMNVTVKMEFKDEDMVTDRVGCSSCTSGEDRDRCWPMSQRGDDIAVLYNFGYHTTKY
ncbi:hypothetical protein EVAR_99522_1 [Eumeta japonica]|uniref:Uncharacterized protein n=1 Tax=Eumeta variegata TaxID=151549 RepID=A0A4C1SDA8_EUMVA|nr:hypothetical protein EVAR_99522_1 [Eumeta japonica]